MKHYILSLIFVLALYNSVRAVSEINTAPPQLGVYEHLDHYLSDDLIFTDERFEKVNLKEELKLPTVLVLVYYECPGLCSPLLNALANTLDKVDIDLGKDFQVFTVSFSPSEKPPLAMQKKKTYTKLVSHGDTKKGWKFFTGDSATINKLLDEVGFQVKKEGDQYVHPTSLIVLSPKGKITRYLYGSTYFLPFDLKMAIVEAQEGRSSPTINKVLNYCFSYDPKGKKYVFNVTKVSGSIILLLALSLLFTMVFKRKKKSNQKINKA